MDDDRQLHKLHILPKSRRRFTGATPMLLGAATGLALFAGWSALRANRRARRYADHGLERRAPLSMFAGGDHPRRREIDYSGTHPLFERRQSVYDAY
ncbi:hypothetical protein [Noviherbaspirillum sedimenti]|uniref:Transmembrane protein n=1 Tax=Noviherbaspirillum sedimenti TaxID=2320865 RepID=A0A3A3G609_9BURK|nr:hypothetical protein [Noviherbaspirillum sedimenti]RJG01952.1 hypothetical protein D3878_10485 [Noviherbaspirillum sedimenti]